MSLSGLLRSTLLRCSPRLLPVCHPSLPLQLAGRAPGAPPRPGGWHSKQLNTRKRRWLLSTSHGLPVCMLGSASGLTMQCRGLHSWAVRKDWGVLMQERKPSPPAAWLSLLLPLHCPGMSSVLNECGSELVFQKLVSPLTPLRKAFRRTAE